MTGVCTPGAPRKSARVRREMSWVTSKKPLARAGALGVHHALRDALTVEVGNLLHQHQVVVLRQDGT
jgi:hypothetical protein